MPFPIPEGQHITIEHGLYPSDHRMPSMEMATDHYNIGFIISGDRRCITPLQTFDYHAGDVSMMPPYIYHRTISESSAPYERYLIKFTPEFAEPFLTHVGQNIFDELFRLNMCCFNSVSQEKIKKMFCEIHEEYEKDVSYKEFILQGMLFRLLTTVWGERLLDKTAVLNKSPLTKPIMDAIYHIETHYNQNLTLEKTARTVSMSTAYFSRLFHTQLGIPFSEYVSNVRMRHVKILLSQSRKSIMEIALETGFSSGDYLSAQFKSKTGMTPGQFRKQSK